MTTDPRIPRMAADHARRHLRKNERNAELRAAGIDPSGPLGGEYRAAFREAIARLETVKVARQLVNNAPRQVDSLAVWDWPASEWSAWCAFTGETLSHAEHSARLDVIEADMLASGQRVIRVAATVAAMSDELKKRNWPNTQQHRAAAIVFLAQK